MHTFRKACQYVLILSVILTCNVIRHGRGHPYRLPCNRNQFTCFSGQCIDWKVVCDGTAHCQDASDETAKVCENIRCPGFMFQCYYGACVKISSVCNGVCDCFDESDEPPINDCRLPPNYLQTHVPFSTTNKYTPFVSEIITTSKAPKTTKRYTSFEPVGWNMTTIKPTFQETSTFSSPTIISTATSSIPGQCRLPESTEERTFSINECTSNLTDAICKSKSGEFVNSGTVLYFTCKHAKYTYENDIFTSYCLENEWLPQIESCKSCGRLSLNERTAGNIPWQTAIYEKSLDRPICWGSVISPYLIVTAAHCFYSELLNRKKDIQNFYASIGKFDGKAATRAELFNITSVRFSSDGFQGAVTNYASDIAIAEISPSLQFTSERNQVCLELADPPVNDKKLGWLSLYKSTGKTAYLETENASYLNFAECINKLSDSSKQLVTSDKLCILNKTIEKGNAGKGLYVQRSGESVYRLRGVFSTTFNDSSKNEKVLTVTDVTRHLSWMNEVIDEINQHRRISETIDFRFPKKKSPRRSKPTSRSKN